MRMTRHNGRTGKDGVFSVKHNDRNFDLENADHINAEQSANNVYWDIRNGFRISANPNQESELIESFDEIEKDFYEESYRAYADAQNARNEKAYHTERNRSPEEIRHHKRTCPEESIYQIGTKDDHVDPDVLLEVVTEFTDKLTEKYGSHMHILDWALHLDESTPHVHERHVFDATNSHGELVPNQDWALEALGFELPDPSKKKGRFNNRKMTFDAACRDLLFDVAKEHGLYLEEEPAYGGRAHMEKQEYIISKQRETITEQQSLIEDLQSIIAGQDKKIDSQKTEIKSNDDDIADQEDRLNDLTIKIEDVEALINEVSEDAYDKAVEVVTDTACKETQKQDIKLIQGTKDWLLSPDRKDSKSKREYAAGVLDHTVNKLMKSAERVLQTVRRVLTSPEKRKEYINQIKKRTRESLYAKVSRNRTQIAEREKTRPQKFIEHQNQQAL